MKQPKDESKMDVIKLNKSSYYLADDIKKTHYKIFSNGDSSDSNDSNDDSNDDSSNNEKEDSIVIVKKPPPILELKDNEKFKDSDDYILNIEVRGKRDYNNCYFKVSDISKEFDLPRLNGTIFTMHLGTKEQKINTYSKSLGVFVDSVKSLFNSSILNFNCVYLCAIGYVKDLRKSMNIPDEYNDYDIVMKYGRTNNSNTSSAETNVKKYFKSLKLSFEYEEQEEIMICDQKMLNDDIKQKYDTKIKFLKLKYKKELVVKDSELSNLKHTVKSLKQKIESLEVKHENELLKLKLKNK